MNKEHAYAYEAGYRGGSIHYELEHCPACENVADLQEALAENAKLRELVADVHEALCSDKAGMFHKLILASMEDDMRELGIEVTE